MDVLRKELAALYARQRLGEERLDEADVTRCVALAGAASRAGHSCTVVTDAACDRSFLFPGLFGCWLGLPATDAASGLRLSSSDEDLVYVRMHPEDLVDKRMLEYEFFKFTETLPAARRTDFQAVCRIRMQAADGTWAYVDNTTRLLHLSPSGRLWLILCCYALSAVQAPAAGIGAQIVDCATGERRLCAFAESRARLLTAREREVLRLIRDGRLSKEIAAALHISVHTVNRHRQNILQKLSVGNSLEAVHAATAMRLL